MAIDDVARQAGVSPRTVSRIKSGLPRQLHVAEG
jgi:DNA-binding LacI/PurR family transcriptional regulator